jgi:endonuclease/exonuclease/phosphatase (EEP) superfamily protein YafD
LPTIVAGDFNLPVESAIYRTHWGDLRNAFSRAGIGTGYTKHTRYWGVRIDHVLASGDIGTHRSFVGRDVGSDHLPLIADLVLPTTQRTNTAR